MESANEIDYKIVDVPTRAVVLFPGRAQVFRDIKDIKLRVSSIVCNLLDATTNNC